MASFSLPHSALVVYRPPVVYLPQRGNLQTRAAWRLEVPSVLRAQPCSQLSNNSQPMSWQITGSQQLNPDKNWKLYLIIYHIAQIRPRLNREHFFFWTQRDQDRQYGTFLHSGGFYVDGPCSGFSCHFSACRLEEQLTKCKYRPTEFSLSCCHYS